MNDSEMTNAKSDTELFMLLNTQIKNCIPGYQIKFKDESGLMKTLGKFMFFNKKFMTNVTTVIGKTIYFPNRSVFKSNPGRYFYTLCHEYVHIMDYVRHPVLFTIGYLMPQALAILSLGALFAFISSWFLLFLLFLLFLAPIPSPFRAWAELRGYGMTIKAMLWNEIPLSKEYVDRYAEHFTGPSYYFMWPFRKRIRKKLQEYVDLDNCIFDSNPAYRDVEYLLRAL